jgi:glycosyltransferase involved in cell wall biosynthesis
MKYGRILSAGLAAARGRYVMTMDGDFSHRPGYVRTMWYHREEADVLIGSRYGRGSYAEMWVGRRILSRILTFLYRTILSLPYRGLSSGFRMYRRRVLEDIGDPSGLGLDFLPELLVRATARDGASPRCRSGIRAPDLSPRYGCSDWERAISARSAALFRPPELGEGR